MLTLKINGESRQFPAPLTVAGLIEQLGYTGKRIAVERNGEIVPKSQHGSTASRATNLKSSTSPIASAELKTPCIN
jgi:sulfur carrier protein